MIDSLQVPEPSSARRVAKLLFLFGASGVVGYVLVKVTKALTDTIDEM